MDNCKISKIVILECVTFNCSRIYYAYEFHGNSILSIVFKWILHLGLPLLAFVDHSSLKIRFTMNGSTPLDSTYRASYCIFPSSSNFIIFYLISCKNLFGGLWLYDIHKIYFYCTNLFYHLEHSSYFKLGVINPFCKKFQNITVRVSDLEFGSP